jgi:hypothetical protein
MPLAASLLRVLLKHVPKRGQVLPRGIEEVLSYLLGLAILNAIPMGLAHLPTYVSRFSKSTFSQGLLYEPTDPSEDILLPFFLSCYLRDFGWSSALDCESVTIRKTFSDSPLLQPPLYETLNEEVMVTLKNCSNLFDVFTPICIDHFRELCRGHPRQDFVGSVVATLQQGSWPWTNTRYDRDFPMT